MAADRRCEDTLENETCREYFIVKISAWAMTIILAVFVAMNRFLGAGKCSRMKIDFSDNAQRRTRSLLGAFGGETSRTIAVRSLEGVTA